jgi:hypothetical protein
VRKQRVFIGGIDDDSKPRKIDVVMISHKFDDDCLYLTLPEIHESTEFHSVFMPVLDLVETNLI